MLGCGQAVNDCDEGRIAVEISVHGIQLVQTDTLCKISVAACQNTPGHRDQMRRKRNGDLAARHLRQLLLYLARMPVRAGHLVGRYALVSLGKMVIQTALTPAGPGTAGLPA